VHCSQITDLLSEYVDDILDPSTRAQVEEHLADCRTCTAELASLRTYLEAMDSLPQVQAPAGFLENLHERLEEPGLFKRLLTWVFFPMKVKLPFEVAGLVAASLLVVLLYRGTEPEKAQFNAVSQAPSAPTSPTPVPSATSRPSVKEPKTDEAPPVSPAPSSPSAQAVLVEKPRKDEAPHVSLQEAARPPVQEPLSAKPQARFSGASPKPVELVLHLTPSTNLQAAPETVLREQPPAGASPTTAAPQAQEQALSRKAAPAPMRAVGKAELAAPASPATTLSRIKELLAQAGGSVLSVDYEKDTQLPQVVTVQLSAQNYPTFSHELRRLGQLEEPAVIPKIANQDALIQLRIRLVPPS
jgi:hypothetical protein